MAQELKNIITNENIITREFNGTEIQFKMVDGQSYVRINEVARFCGWTTVQKNGNETIRWKRVNEKLDNLGYANVGINDFIPENIMYPLIGMADFKKNPKAREFMLWVGQVLVQLRTTGVVITEKATEEAIDFEKKYGTYRIRKTFTNSNNLRADWEEFKDLSKAEWKAKRLSGQDRIKLHNIIFDAISKRLQNNITELKGSEMLAMQELLTDIKSDTLKLCNNVNGGIKRGQTQEIGKLKAEIESLKPTPLEDMVCINYHAFSYDNSALDKDGHWKPAYRTWIKNFPMEEIPNIDYWLDRGVDFNKPVKIIIKCINKKEFDTTNLVKAIQDVLFNKERGKYRADDNFIRAGEIETIDFCDDYSDGKMYIDLENIDNCNIIDTNMDANINEQLHNQEFAEFVSNLFGDF